MLDHEWSVMVTDWLLAAMCLWSQRRLRTARTQSSVRAVSWAFATAAVAAGIGGLRHGMGPWLPEPVSAVLRLLSYVVIVPAVAMLWVGVMRSTVRRNWWLVGAVTLSVIAVTVQIGVPFGVQGTLHNDLFHLLMMPAVYAYYRAALLLKEAPDAPSQR